MKREKAWGVSPENGTRKHGNVPYDRTGMFVVFDYETSGLHPDDGAYPSTLALKWGPTEYDQAIIPVDQGILDKPGTTPTLFGDAPNVSVEEWIAVHEWMAKQHLIAHNAKADLWFAQAGLRKDRNVQFDLSDAFYWDTLVAEALFNPGQRVSLDIVARRNAWGSHYESIDQAMKAWSRKHKQDGEVRYDLAPWDILEPYAAADVDRTWKLFQQQAQRMAEGELGWELVQREMALVVVLFRMEKRGLPYDVRSSLQAAGRAATEMANIEQQLLFDPHNKAEVIRWLQSYGVPLEKTEKGTTYKLDQACMARAVEHGAAGAELWQRHSKLSTARSLWYQGWAEKAGGGRVRANYRQVKTWEGNNSSGTVSGRFAVTRVQVQAIPNKYQIPEGYPAMHDLIVGDTPVYEADISQAEMRVAASLSGCTSMIDGFLQGFDAHDSTTRLIWGIEKDDPVWKQRRAVAKRLGFGVLYGAGIKTLRKQIVDSTGEDLGEDGVRDLWDEYRRAFPELFTYNREVKQFVERNGFLVLTGGKIRKFNDFEPSFKAFNAAIQGAVAVGMTEAMIGIEEQLPGIMVGQVHDSVLLETDDQEKARNAAAIIQYTFERLFDNCPFVVDFENYQEKE